MLSNILFVLSDLWNGIFLCYVKKAEYRWILEPADGDAVLANVAIKKPETDAKVVIEISCIRTPEELLAIRKAYQNRYKRSLEEDVAAHTSGDLRKVHVQIVYLCVCIYTITAPFFNTVVRKAI